MYLSETQVKTLLLFSDQHTFKHLGLNLLVTRLKELYKADPSPENLHHCKEEINSFIQKYEILLTYDIAQLISLKEDDL